MEYKKTIFMNNLENFGYSKIRKSKEEIMDTLKKICLVLIIIGALNWAFVGLFDIDLVATVFGGTDNIIAKIIYIIIGIAGLIDISMLFDRD